MKRELADDLRAAISARQLPTTGSSEADPGALTVPDDSRPLRLAVRSLLGAVDALLVDAPKRRRDLEEWSGRVLDLEQGHGPRLSYLEVEVAGLVGRGDPAAEVERLRTAFFAAVALSFAVHTATLAILVVLLVVLLT